MANSPKLIAAPPLALPPRSGWCCLRCLTRRGMSMVSALRLLVGRRLGRGGLDSGGLGHGRLDSGRLDGRRLDDGRLHGRRLDGGRLGGRSLSRSAAGLGATGGGARGARATRRALGPLAALLAVG